MSERRSETALPLIASIHTEWTFDDLVEIITAAATLYDFLWNEKATSEPPSELVEAGYASLVTHEDYDKEERLTLALGKALKREDAV